MSNYTAVYSQSFYNHLNNSVLATSGVIGIVLIWLFFLLYRCCNKDLALRLAYAVSKTVFSGLEVSTEDGKTTYSLFGCPIPFPKQLACLAIILVTSSYILGITVFVALRVGLLEKSFTCGSGFDCFDANGTYIEDCNDLDGEYVICYKLVQRFDLVVGALGGFLTVASTSVNFYGNVMLPILMTIINKYDKKVGQVGCILATAISYIIYEGLLLGILFITRDQTWHYHYLVISIAIVMVAGILPATLWYANRSVPTDLAVDNNSPSADNNSPSADNNSPSADNNSPSADNNSPSADNNSPSADNNSPSADNNSPSADNCVVN